MKLAKFFLVFLLIIALVLLIVLAVVGGWDLGIGKRVVEDSGQQTYSVRDREEILAAMQAAASPSTLYYNDSNTNENRLTPAGREVFEAMVAVPLEKYDAEDRREILESLKNQ